MAIDYATILGLLLGFTLIMLAISVGGDVPAFLDLPSALIVIGGTFAITMVCFTLQEIWRTQKTLLKTMVFRLPDETGEARMMLELAQRARTSGLLGIQKDIETVSDPFVRQSLRLAVDGVNPEAIEAVMRGDTESMLDR